ncbi:hypothetical protein XELAEV_18028076mg [Xenopus laevis]|uniref:Uncharacterized protein n=1 Tax=Xenopus laevis TaxID=8355 RepID=A0A974HKC6_XENLA|nr:hypothetical protein XELAEV_18028076mg [Xenopus laevis]
MQLSDYLIPWSRDPLPGVARDIWSGVSSLIGLVTVIYRRLAGLVSDVWVGEIIMRCLQVTRSANKLLVPILSPYSPKYLSELPF